MREVLSRHPWLRKGAAAVALGLASWGVYEVFTGQGQGPESATIYERTIELDDLVVDLPSDGIALEEADETTDPSELKCNETVHVGLVQDGELNLYGNPACSEVTLGQAENVMASHAELQSALTEGREPAWEDALGGAALVTGLGLGAAALLPTRGSRR